MSLNTSLLSGVKLNAPFAASSRYIFHVGPWYSLVGVALEIPRVGVRGAMEPVGVIPEGICKLHQHPCLGALKQLDVVSVPAVVRDTSGTTSVACTG